jgi:hypothetical protein
MNNADPKDGQIDARKKTGQKLAHWGIDVTSLFRARGTVSLVPTKKGKDLRGKRYTSEKRFESSKLNCPTSQEARLACPYDWPNASRQA